MLLGKTYEEAFSLLYPGVPIWERHPGLTSRNIQQTAKETLESLGFEVRQSKYKKLRSLIKYTTTPMLIIIRWSWGGDEHSSEENPWLCHAVVFDGETKRFLDPSDSCYIHLRTYQRQLDSIFYVKLPQKPTTIQEGVYNEQGRYDQGDQRGAYGIAGARYESHQDDRVIAGCSA